MVSVVELIRERFSELTEIQKIAIPKILAGEHTLVLAETGAGKSEAVWLPVLEKIKDKKEGIRALYISPLRALGRDQYARFKWWCEKLGVTHAVRTGDTTQAERAKHRKDAPQILITTPESLQALLIGPVMRQHLKNIEFVIIDEVHDILDNKRGTQLSLGLERLELLAPNFQRIAVSATVADEEEAAKLVFGQRNYGIAEIAKGRKMDISVEYITKQEERIKRLKELCEAHKTLLFVNTRSTAEELGADLKKVGAPIEVHHGSLSKEVRIAAEDKFKSGEIKSLLATSSLELGIDIGDIDLVIQYGSPHQAFRLIQRIGRSGHSLQKTPRGIVIATDFDDYLEAEAISTLASSMWIENKNAERAAYDVIAHQIIGLCFDLWGVDAKSIHNTFAKSYAYNISFGALKKILLQLFAEGLIFYDEIDAGQNANIKLKSRAREYYYSNLTTIPKERRYVMKEAASNKIIASLDETFVMNLENNTSFLAKGLPWQIIDITESEVLVEPSSALDIAIPDWTGEDIPVNHNVAQAVGKLRASGKRNISPLPDDRTIVIELVEDVLVIHACLGSKINETLARVFSYKLSNLIGESVRAIADAYRILVKLPFPLDQKYIMQAFSSIKHIRSQLEISLENSFLLKLKFTHVARLFGLLEENATITQRFLHAMRNNIVYEETLRTIYFHYFDVDGAQDVIDKIEKKEIVVVLDKRAQLSYFAKLGIEKTSAKEAVGGFEPRQVAIAALKERVLSKTLELKCLNCNATRFLHLAGAPEKISCHKCNTQALTIIEKNKTQNPEPTTQNSQLRTHTAALIRNYGKQALIALSTYGIGPYNAERVLKKLHRNKDEFYLDLLEAQKNFIKNKKYWQFD